MKKKITARDIARACGVSQATVSYVINNKENQKIAAETRQKILKAIEEMHYYPNVSARHMKSRSSAAVGIVCAKDYSRQAFLDALEGISEYFSKIHYTMIIFYEETDGDRYVASYFSELIDGLIFISNSDHDDFIRPAAENRIPYAVICLDGVFSRRSPRPDAFRPALAECLDYCRGNGLKKIRYFSVDNGGRLVNNKFPDFSGLAADIYPECDLAHVVCPVRARSYDQIHPYLAEYLKRESFDIAVCQNYDIGLAVQNEILKRGIAVPQSPKLIILNDVNFYGMLYPSLSGIRIPYREMGVYAAELAVAVIEEREDEFTYMDFTCTLIHRDSSRMR